MLSWKMENTSGILSAGVQVAEISEVISGAQRVIVACGPYGSKNSFASGSRFEGFGVQTYGSQDSSLVERVGWERAG